MACVGDVLAGMVSAWVRYVSYAGHLRQVGTGVHGGWRPPSARQHRPSRRISVCCAACTRMRACARACVRARVHACVHKPMHRHAQAHMHACVCASITLHRIAMQRTHARAQAAARYMWVLLEKALLVPVLRANTTSCQHHFVPTPLCANTTSCQHYFVLTPLRANTTLCQHYFVSSGARHVGAAREGAARRCGGGREAQRRGGLFWAIIFG